MGPSFFITPAGYGAPAPPPPPSYGAPPPPPPPPTPYAYNYAVLDAESGNDFSAEEEGDEHGKVVGQYKVLRADGIIMTVTYTVEGDSGFVADIATEAAPPAPASYGAPPPPPPPAPLPYYV
ncbi:Cuticular protein hypothetical 5 [Caligus rogercresseyi]|uniref:Cuticular protein hypothetical 5 n=1 Tax=Caligus rogercresseyi TaxID=217165 RepID=A0A7T8K9R9_CALRO|nr:Cuticular protein hypothetical 5 [Caligus rogercresseyi]